MCVFFLDFLSLMFFHFFDRAERLGMEKNIYSIFSYVLKVNSLVHLLALKPAHEPNKPKVSNFFAAFNLKIYYSMK